MKNWFKILNRLWKNVRKPQVTGVHVSLFEKIGGTGRADGRTDRVQHLMLPSWSHSKPCLYDKLHLLIQLFFRSNSRWIHVADKQNRSLSIAESMCQPCQGDMERDGCGSWTRIRQRELTGQQTQKFCRRRQCRSQNYFREHADEAMFLPPQTAVTGETLRIWRFNRWAKLKWWLNSFNAAYSV